MSLSMVAGTPTVLTPAADSFWAPRKVPSPPMAMTPSMPAYLQVRTACATPSGVVNSLQRAV